MGSNCSCAELIQKNPFFSVYISVVESQFANKRESKLVSRCSDYALQTDDREIFVLFRGRWKRLFRSPKLPDRLWVPPALLFSEYGGFFPSGKPIGR
jgi:hypothetical protein